MPTAISVEAANDRVSELEAEQERLQSAVSELETQSKAIDAGLDELYAKAERTGTTDAQQAVERVENDKQAIATQLRRKKAALAACASELAQARTDAHRAKLIDDVRELERIHGEMVTISDKLSANISQPDLWLSLVRLTEKGRSVYTPGGDLWALDQFNPMFNEPLTALNRVQEQLRHAVEYAIGRRIEHPNTPSVGIELGLDMLKRRIASLRQRIN